MSEPRPDLLGFISLAVLLKWHSLLLSNTSRVSFLVQSCRNREHNSFLDLQGFYSSCSAEEKGSFILDQICRVSLPGAGAHVGGGREAGTRIITSLLGMQSGREF